MPFLTNEQKQSFGGLINAAGYVLSCAVMVAIVDRFLIDLPGFISWLTPLNDLIIFSGAIAVGVVVYSNNKLIK